MRANEPLSSEPGYFVFSLDTELAWGLFDQDDRREREMPRDGAAERVAVKRLLDLCDEFGIVGTWAVVGHLFYAECERCEICPVQSWRGRYRSFDEAFETAHPLWYGADVVDAIIARHGKHEIAFHGYTHEVFDERRMSEEAARTEIAEWKRVALRRGVVPLTVIFPRNRAGHLSLFRDAGFICYRSDDRPPAPHRLPYVGRLLKSIDHCLGLSTPPVHPLEARPNGMVDLAPTEHVFGFNRRLDVWLNALGFPRLRVRRMVRAVRRASREGKIAHFWVHPWEFRSEGDFDKLRYLFEAAAAEIARGRLRSIGMADLARITLARNAAESAA